MTDAKPVGKTDNHWNDRWYADVEPGQVLAAIEGGWDGESSMPLERTEQQLKRDMNALINPAKTKINEAIGVLGVFESEEFERQNPTRSHRTTTMDVAREVATRMLEEALEALDG